MTDAQEKDLTTSGIGDTFRQIISHMKGGFPVWEDFLTRGLKFQRQLEQSIAAFNSFLEGLNKIAELATHAKGSTREVGTGLTNLVMWHRGQELKLREMNQAFMNKLLGPLQMKVEEWKKTASQLDRDHEKEVQRSIKEIRETTKSTVKVSKNLESKLKKDKPSEKCRPLQQQLEQFQQETNRRIKETEEKERRNLTRVLQEERSWFCGLTNAFARVLDVEVTMLGDLDRLQAIIKDLDNTIAQPTALPEASRKFVEGWSIPASPAVSRKRGSDSVRSPPPLATEEQNRPPIPPPPPGPIGPTPPRPPPQSHYPPPPAPNYPPPPAPNFLPPPAPNYPQEFNHLPDNHNYEAIPFEPALSVSPSQASLMSTSSHHSSESSRSLSPPVGPTRSPAQSRAQLVSLHEEENAPSEFQQALMNKLRMRSQSAAEETDCPPPINPRTLSLGCKPSPPPVLNKPSRPPAIPQKPLRTPTLAEISISARHSPQLPMHHVLAHGQSSREDSSSESEDDSPFARALRQQKLRKTTQVYNRSNPSISSR